jgi:hypothetical protein
MQWLGNIYKERGLAGRYEVVLILTCEKRMKKIPGLFLIGTVLFSSVVIAEDRAVNISISSKGVPVEDSAVLPFRKFVRSFLRRSTKAPSTLFMFITHESMASLYRRRFIGVC